MMMIKNGDNSKIDNIKNIKNINVNINVLKEIIKLKLIK